MKLIFATNNQNKASEISQILKNRFEILTMNQVGIDDDIIESEPTLEGNALLKAHHIYQNYGYDCFADDTGLEVEALGGEPGVNSARYASSYNVGESHNAMDNMQLLLENLKGIDNRKGQFRTVIALIIGGKEYLFEGVVKGVIASEQSGSNGFGYDPIFIPDGYSVSFADMDINLKNKISHRSLAIERMASFLEALPVI